MKVKVAQSCLTLCDPMETWVRFLGWEDALEKGKAIHSKYSGLENSVDCIVHGVAESNTTEGLSLSSNKINKY